VKTDNDLHVVWTVSRKWVAGPIVNRQLEPRSFHAACVVGCKLMIVGGRGLQDQHFADVHVFDTGRWLDVTYLPQGTIFSQQ